MNQNKLFRTALFVFLALTLLLTGCATTASAVTGSVGTVSTINMQDTIETSGSLSADQLSALTWSTSGTVEKVNVVVGQSVKAGEVLAVLKADSVPADLVTAQADLASVQRDLEDVLDAQSDLATANLAVANAQSAVDTAQKTYDSLYYPRASDALIHYTEAQISAAKLTVAETADHYRLVQNKADGNVNKTTAKLAWSNAQLNLNNLLATYAWYTGKPTATDVAVAKETLEDAKVTLAEAQKKYAKLQNGPDPVDVAAAQAKVTAAQAEVNQMAVLAPFDGVVLTVQTAVGNPVNSGDAAIEMVNRSTLKIDALVDETSISTIKVGDTASITMDLLPNVTLTGKVTTIGSIGTTVNGLVKYTVTIALDATEQPVRFGATTDIVINTSEPHNALAVPVNAVQSDSQGEYVTLIKASGTTERIAVESGDLSNGLVTITAAGLKDGDQVAVNATSTTSTSSSSSSTSTKNSGAGGMDGGGMPPMGGPGGM
jgi:HlyD family secretion protein